MHTLSKHKYLLEQLPLSERVENLISLLTIEEKISLLPTRQAAIPRLNINEYSVGGEAAHGVVSPLGASTIFPQPIGLACTFDKKLLYDIGSVIGDEARIYYNKDDRKSGLTLWAPTIDMERDPRWGRTEEAYGEDPILTGKLSSNLIKGMQGNDDFYLKLVPAPKHFYANNNEDERTYCSSTIDPRNKYEYYLKPFKLAFTEGKAKSLMTAYNSINGTPCILNNEVNTIVKSTWGCDGFVVCDGGDFSQTVDHHKYYNTHAETIASALKAGIDCFTDDAELVINAAKEAIEKGLIQESDIDIALRNIFRIRFRLGQFDDDSLNPYSNISEEKLCCDEHSSLALKACNKSIVLLKNENNLLPLKNNAVKKIAVIGPLANEIYKDWYCGDSPYNVTILQGIKNTFTSSDILYNNGNDIVNLTSKDSDFQENFELSNWGFDSITLKNTSNNKFLTIEEDDRTISSSADKIWGWFVKEVFKANNITDNSFTLKTWDNSKIAYKNNNLMTDSSLSEDIVLNKNLITDGISEAKKIAQDSDISIVVVGNHPLINGKEEIDRSDIILPPHQEELIKAVYSANPNTIVVIVGSYPFAINWCMENIPAIIYCTHGCQELGNSIAKCISGEISPSGRLPMTWYKSIRDLPSINDYDIINNNTTYMYYKNEPLYPFGHGLTYTSFKYSNLILSSKSICNNQSIEINTLIENTGDFESDEVVQLYVSTSSKRVKSPQKKLIDFERIHLLPNESKWTKFTLSSDDLKYYDVSTEDFFLEAGNCTVMVGSSSSDIRLSKELIIDGSPLIPRDLTSLTKAENFDSWHNLLLDECTEGGTVVRPRTNNLAWIKFSDVDFNNEIKSITLRHLPQDSCSIEIKKDSLEGDSIGFINISPTSYDCEYINTYCEICNITGVHDLYILINGTINLSTLKLNIE